MFSKKIQVLPSLWTAPLNIIMNFSRGWIQDSESQMSDSDLELIDGDDPASELVSDDEIEIDAVPATRKILPKENERPVSDEDFWESTVIQLYPGNRPGIDFDLTIGLESLETSN